MRIVRWLGILALALTLPPGEAAADGVTAGLLLLAHGVHADMDGHGINPWNDTVARLTQELDREVPTELALGMADPASIQAAVDRLEKRGVDRIVAVPLFISSYSPIIGNFRYILGLQDQLAATTSLRHLDRVKVRAKVIFTGAMDAHPLIGEILLDRARALATDPSRTHVVLIGHGPNDEGENRLWLRDLETHAAFLRSVGGFRSVAALTRRDDAAADVKAEARAAFRRTVDEASRVGPVLVIPVLLSAGGIEEEAARDLDGLSFALGAPLMPHPNVRKWVEAKLAESAP